MVAPRKAAVAILLLTALITVLALWWLPGDRPPCPALEIQAGAADVLSWLGVRAKWMDEVRVRRAAFAADPPLDPPGVSGVRLWDVVEARGSEASGPNRVGGAR